MSPSFDHIALLGPQPACRVPQAHSGLAIFFLVAPVVTDSSVPLASRRPPVAPAVQPERWLTVTGCQSRVAPAVSTQPHAGRRMSAAPPSVPTMAHGPLDAPKVSTRLQPVPSARYRVVQHGYSVPFESGRPESSSVRVDPFGTSGCHSLYRVVETGPLPGDTASFVRTRSMPTPPTGSGPGSAVQAVRRGASRPVNYGRYTAH